MLEILLCKKRNIYSVIPCKYKYPLTREYQTIRLINLVINSQEKSKVALCIEVDWFSILKILSSTQHRTTDQGTSNIFCQVCKCKILYLVRKFLENRKQSNLHKSQPCNISFPLSRDTNPLKAITIKICKKYW